MTTSLSPHPQNKGDVCSLPHPSNLKFEPQVGVNKGTDPFSFPPKDVASTNKRARGQLLPSLLLFILSAAVTFATSSSLLLIWYFVRNLLFGDPKDVGLPIGGAISFIIFCLLILCGSIYIGCMSVYCAVILAMRRLPEDVALKIKANFENNVAVSGAASCCSLFLFAICCWRLDDAIKNFTKYPHRQYPLMYLCFLYSMAFASFSFVWLLCVWE